MNSKERHKQWVRDNRDKYNAYQRAYKKRPGSYYQRLKEAERAKTRERLFNQPCVECGESLMGEWQLHDKCIPVRLKRLNNLTELT